MNVTVKDVSHYLGYGNTTIPDNETVCLIEKSIEQIKEVSLSKCVYKEFDLDFLSETKISFGDVVLESKDLSKNLKNCSKIILAAVTVGSAVDLLIRKSQYVDSSFAVVMQACGAAFAENTIEELNNKLANEYNQKGYKTHPRFSPGYGDVSLDVQKIFFRLLPCSKIGLSLMDSLIMAPEKSITAFIGLEKVVD